MLPPAAPQRLGKYEILEVLGEGAAAVVYRARDTELGREVALKVLRAAWASMRSARERFHREARLSASLAHPNIVTVHDAGEQDDALYLVLELVEGRPLADLMRERAPLARLVQLVEGAARGLEAAHARGIVHRDLKPANILVAADGTPKVTDFGLAQAVEREAKLTRSGETMGTPLYMAPEQVGGQTTDITARTDIYALGAILYECATGRTPHRGRNLSEIFTRIVTEEPAPPRSVNPSVPEDLEVIILKALDKDPERRYFSAGDLADELGRWRSGEPIHARPTTAFYRIRKRFARNRAAVLMGAGGFLVAGAIALAIIAAWTGRERAQAGRREEALRELGSLWAQVVLAKQALHSAATDPQRACARIRAAVDRVSEFLARHPDHPQAHYVRARGWLYLDDLDAAERDARRAVAIEDAFAPGHALLGRVLLERYRSHSYGASTTREEHRYVVQAQMDRVRPLLDEAGRHLARGAVAGDAGDWERRWGLPRTPEDEIAEVVGRALVARYGRDDRAAAIRVLEEADAREPSAEYANWIGVWVEGREERVTWQTKSIERMPHYAKAWFDRGVARMENDDFAGAVADFTRALEINPRYVEALANRAAARGVTGETDEAIADATRAIEIDPRFLMAYTNRAFARMRKDDFDGAIADHDKALEIDPAYAFSWAWRGTARARKGDFAGAIADLTKAVELNPQYAPAWHNRAVAKHDVGDLDGAIADCTKALEANPRYLDAAFRRGLLRGMTGDVDGAIADLTLAIEIDGRHATAHSNRAVARYKKGDPAGALSDWSRALELNPKDVNSLLNRAAVLESRGDREGAIRDFERVLEVAAEGAPARRQAEKALRRLRAGP